MAFRPSIFALAAALAVALPVPLGAQDDAPAEDAGFLEGLIQNALGGEGRDVRVIGLQGALSSEATISRIEIADADGVWLVVRDVALDWNRLALLRRRLNVEALTVGSVELRRPPLPGPVQPPALAAEAEPQPFSLPELPVAVEVQEFSIGGLLLQEPVLGQAVTASIDGSAQLAGGEGQVDLSVVRIDAQDGRFSLEAGFDNETRRLFVDLDVVEEEGGLIASLANMPGEPSLDLSVAGDGPISDFTAELDLQTDGVERLDGTIAISEAEGPEGAPATRVVEAQVTGDVAELFLPEYRDFFGRELSLDLLARQNPETGLSVETLRVDTQGFTLDATAELSPGFVPRRVSLDAEIANPLGLPVVLPLPGSPTLVHGADLTLAYDAAEGEDLVLDLVADGVMRADGLLIDRLALGFDGTLDTAGGTALDSADGRLTAALSGLSTTDPALWEAVGDNLDLAADIAWSDGGPLTITDLALQSGENLMLAGEAAVTGLQSGIVEVAADMSAEAGSLERFAPIAGQDLSGALAADLTASYNLSSGAFDIDLEGRGQDLSFGQPDADALLEGDSTLRLSAARTAEGIVVDQLSIDARDIDLDGQVSLAPSGFPTLVDLTATLATPDGAPVRLPLPGPPAEIGRAEIRVAYDRAAGETFDLLIAAQDFARDGLSVGRARIAADGTVVPSDGLIPERLDGTLSAEIANAGAEDPELDALLDPGLALDADIAARLSDGIAELTDLTLSSGEVRVTGDATATGIDGDTPEVTADVALDTGPLARFAGLAGQELGGRLQASLQASFAAATGFFDVDLTGTGTDLALGIPEADALLAGDAVLRLDASRDADGLTVETLTLDNPVLALDASAALDPTLWPRRVSVDGRLADPEGAPLALPVPGQEVTLGGLTLAAQYDATEGDAFRLNLAATDLTGPEGLAIGRTTVTADGTLARDGSDIERLAAALSAEIANATAADPALARALAPGAALSADLGYVPDDGTASLQELRLTSGALSLAGSADLAALDTETPAAAADFALDTGPLSRFAPLVGQPLSGTLTATGDAAYELGSGAFEVTLDADGSGLGTGIAQLDPLIAGDVTVDVQAARSGGTLSLPQFRIETPQLSVMASGESEAGSGTFDVDARLADLSLLAEGFPGAVTLDGQVINTGATWSVDAALDGPGGINARIAGDVIRPDGNLDLNATGGLSLGLANRIIAPRVVNGDLNFDLSIEGPPALDSVSGTISTGGARISDPLSRLALEDTNATISLAGGTARLDVDGDLNSGGQVSLSGPVTLSGNFPADLSLALDNIRLVDPRLYEVNLDGQLSMEGPLLGGAAITGRIDVGRSEIKIPAGLGGGGTLIDVVHVGESAESRLTRRRAGLLDDEDGNGRGGGGGPVYPLDIVISAPNQIFVRGRGLDAELGGEIVIGGTTADIQPRGELSLIRGRLSLLARRLDFDEAVVSLQGDLVPDIRMVATSSSDAVQAQIIIEGPINDPEVSFSSQPELPEDEVLAQLFFNKPLNELSALEVAQLAGAINTLRGGSGGLLGSIRERLGVDDLSVERDREGNTAVTAGRYLSERVYTDVTVGAEGTSEIELNYEFTDSLDAEIGFDNDGNAAIGFSFQRDY